MAINMTGFGGAVSVGGAPAPANPFDMLSPEEFEELQMLAESAAAGGVPEGEETPADEAAEPDEPQQAEADAGTELHTPEQMAGIALDMKLAVENCVADLEAKLAEAEENDDSDPKKIGKLLKQAKELLDDAEEAAGEAEQAIADEDIGAAAEAAAECERLNEEAHALVAEATGLVGTPPEPEEGEEGAGAKAGGSKPAPAAKGAQKGKPRPAMAVWADRAS